MATWRCHLALGLRADKRLIILTYSLLFIGGGNIQYSSASASTRHLLASWCCTGKGAKANGSHWPRTILEDKYFGTTIYYHFIVVGRYLYWDYLFAWCKVAGECWKKFNLELPSCLRTGVRRPAWSCVASVQFCFEFVSTSHSRHRLSPAPSQTFSIRLSPVSSI